MIFVERNGHRAASCADKGKCFHCHEAGHFARHCIRPWGNHTGPSAPPPAAEVHPHAGNGVPPLVHADDLDQGFGPLSGGVVWLRRLLLLRLSSRSLLFLQLLRVLLLVVGTQRLVVPVGVPLTPWWLMSVLTS